MNPKAAALLKRLNGIEDRRNRMRRPVFVAFGPGEDPRVMLAKMLPENPGGAGRTVHFINTGISARLTADNCSAASLSADLPQRRADIAAIWRTSIEGQRQQARDSEREL